MCFEFRHRHIVTCMDRDSTPSGIDLVRNRQSDLLPETTQLLVDSCSYLRRSRLCKQQSPAPIESMEV
jgi:hypothetical protein